MMQFDKETILETLKEDKEFEKEVNKLLTKRKEALNAELSKASAEISKTHSAMLNEMLSKYLSSDKYHDIIKELADSAIQEAEANGKTEDLVSGVASVIITHPVFRDTLIDYALSNKTITKDLKDAVIDKICD